MNGIQKDLRNRNKSVEGKRSMEKKIGGKEMAMKKEKKLPQIMIIVEVEVVKVFLFTQSWFPKIYNKCFGNDKKT